MIILAIFHHLQGRGSIQKSETDLCVSTWLRKGPAGLKCCRKTWCHPIAKTPSVRGSVTPVGISNRYSSQLSKIATWIFFENTKPNAKYFAFEFSVTSSDESMPPVSTISIQAIIGFKWFVNVFGVGGCSVRGASDTLKTWREAMAKDSSPRVPLRQPGRPVWHFP